MFPLPVNKCPFVWCFDNKTTTAKKQNQKQSLIEASFSYFQDSGSLWLSVLLCSHDKNGQMVSCIPHSEEMGEKGPVTHRLVFINGVLDTPAALRDPRRVKHWDRWHSKYRWGQGEVYTGWRDLLVDTRRVRWVRWSRSWRQPQVELDSLP